MTNCPNSSNLFPYTTLFRTLWRDLHPRVTHDPHEVGEKRLRLLARQEPDVQRGARQRRNDVRLVTALKPGDGDGVAKERVVGPMDGEEENGSRLAAGSAD